MGTVEGNFSIESFLDELKDLHPVRVHLAPFMIVAGDHAHNDLAGDDADSKKVIQETLTARIVTQNLQPENQ